MNLKDAMERARLEWDLQTKTSPRWKIQPSHLLLPGFYRCHQEDRADIIAGPVCLHFRSSQSHSRGHSKIQSCCRLDKVIVCGPPTPSKFCEVTEGVHDTEDNHESCTAEALKSIHRRFAMASLLRLLFTSTDRHRKYVRS